MQVSLHKNARTTPAVRAEIAAGNETAAILAKRYGITSRPFINGNTARVLPISRMQRIAYKPN